MKNVVITLGLLGMVGAGRADTLILQSGGHVEGVVLKEEDGKAIIHLKHGMATLNRDDIASIVRDETATKGRRIVPWTTCYHSLKVLPWGADLRPTAAMIIDSGPFKNVPYTSDRSGNREFNLYGDPDQPAGLEFGLSKFLAKDTDARKEVLSLLKILLPDAKDGEALATIDPKIKSRKEVDGLVIEVEETQNAAGDPTCFLSVYLPKALDEIRVADKDVPRSTPIGSDNSGKPGPGSGTVAGPGGSSSGPGTTTTAPSSPPGSFGFSPSALNGDMPQPSRPRSYSGGGVNWDLWWRMNHPPPPPPPPPPPAKKPKTPTK